MDNESDAAPPKKALKTNLANLEVVFLNVAIRRDFPNLRSFPNLTQSF